MTESLTDGVTLGIYEKALVGNPLATDDDWRRFLNQVPEAGFSFVDLSVDESEAVSYTHLTLPTICSV